MLKSIHISIIIIIQDVTINVEPPRCRSIIQLVRPNGQFMEFRVVDAEENLIVAETRQGTAAELAEVACSKPATRS
jgi:hypothetical protein